MTALNLANIPSNINTYERLAFWACQALQDTTNGMTLNVVRDQGNVPMVQCQIAKVADGSDRAILSAYLPVDVTELNSDTEKTWMAAGDLATAAPNAVYLSN